MQGYTMFDATQLSAATPLVNRTSLPGAVTELGEVDVRCGVSAAGIRTLRRVAAAWSLDEEQMARLMGAAIADWRRWISRPDAVALDRQVMLRVSYLLGIYRALHLMFASCKQADTWLHRNNRAKPFGGRSALDYMLDGRLQDLHYVRRYLDAQRGGWV